MNGELEVGTFWSACVRDTVGPHYKLVAFTNDQVCLQCLVTDKLIVQERAWFTVDYYKVQEK